MDVVLGLEASGEGVGGGSGGVGGVVEDDMGAFAGEIFRDGGTDAWYGSLIVRWCSWGWSEEWGSDEG